jgi:hypothetical protein
MIQRCVATVFLAGCQCEPRVRYWGPAAGIDANVSRTFSIKEKLRLQIMGEAFNLTNTPSFGQPGSGFTPPTLNADGSVKSYNGFGVITSTTSTARVLQVGATLRF